MPDNIVTPLIDKTLLDYLKAIFPLQPPKMEDADRKIWMDAGAQNVIQHLIHLHEKQTRGDATCASIAEAFRK